MEKIQVQITALSNSESSPGNFVVVLEDPVSKKRFPLIIGTAEAQAIAIYMEQLTPPRPLTHDLFTNTLQQLGASLTEIYIHSIHNTTFISSLWLRRADNSELHIDARPSDALALAIRFNAAITIAADIFEDYAIGEIATHSLLRGSVWEYSLPELELILSDLLAKEDYESAAKVRDVIEKKRDKT
jgi:uncharacterized protein